MAKTSDIKILIVDDEKGIRESIAGLFRAFGFDVVTAHSGNRAWDLCLNQSFHIVVTDVRMANGTGIELLEKFRHKGLESPKVFIISGYTDYSFEEIFSLGADGIFSKPFDSKLLMNTVRHALLSYRDRWSKPPEKEPGKEILTRFHSMKQAEDDKKFILGRGGFYIQLTGDVSPIMVDEEVWFEIDFESEEQKNIYGSGVVRWIKLSSGGKPGGMGIQISSLTPETLLSTCEFIERLVKAGYSQRSLPVIPASPF